MHKAILVGVEGKVANFRHIDRSFPRISLSNIILVIREGLFYSSADLLALRGSSLSVSRYRVSAELLEHSRTRLLCAHLLRSILLSTRFQEVLIDSLVTTAETSNHIATVLELWTHVSRHKAHLGLENLFPWSRASITSFSRHLQ